ncbi:glycosyltransferase [Subtercola vilae]|uniref:Glycosyltransferase family 1 protein n=1 Tax=Subtercola vilae TaxID=2056433 RepID=A0A4T2C101_9MICO|nr:glycosyltransferase [Subtercola vilae]TIH37805.1 glycosyltransferase family 1 protein [Subtercola vilae]
MSLDDDWKKNLATLITQFGGVPHGSTHAELTAELASALDTNPTWSNIWLTWATLRAELPFENDVVTFRRHVKLSGAAAALRDLRPRADSTIFGYSATVEIVTDAILVDVHDTSGTDKISGIQRVVRETVGRWVGHHEITLLAWTENRSSLRRLTPEETARIHPAVREDGDDSESAKLVPVHNDRQPAPIVIPNGGLLIVPELSAEGGRALRLLALARFSGTRTAYIGYDQVPVTSGETASEGIASHFPLYLDAVAYSERVLTISESTAVEFRAWKNALAASGRTGPEVQAVFLSGDSLLPTDDDITQTRALLKIDATPMVLVVGSHEPRKNHLSVLQAARSLWRRGLKFQLVFIGGAGWNSAAFENLTRSMRDDGYPLTVVKAATDALLSSSYRLADVSVFTSFHEGFGLPIVESLRAGTPVIASNVGSMQEIADRYAGVTTIDPHSDDALESALERFLTDHAFADAERAAIAANSFVTWDDYAAVLWNLFTG